MATAVARERGGRRLRPSPAQACSEGIRHGEHFGLILAAAAALPRTTSTAIRYRLADGGGEGAYRFPLRRFRPAEGRYRIFAGNPTRARRLTRRALRNCARTGMDLLVPKPLVRSSRGAPARVESGSLRVPADLRTAIAIPPYLGNGDLGAAMTATAGRREFPLADRFDPRAGDRRVRSTRQREGGVVIPSGPSRGGEGLRALRRGDVLCRATDMDHSGTGGIGLEPAQWFAFHRLPAPAPGGGR